MNRVDQPGLKCREFIRDGVFGFFPFHKGLGFASFPSGHGHGSISLSYKCPVCQKLPMKGCKYIYLFDI